MNSFDYVVIGGGTAGCVVASRLTKNRDVSVLVLESGPSWRGLAIEVPGALGDLYTGGKFHWHHLSEPEPHANNRQLPYKLGRIVGGSSAINGMVWVRGSARDFDDWAAQGCDGWSYEDVAPLYRRIEDYEDPNDAYMGQSGPISITRGDTTTPLNSAFLRSAEQAGYPLNDNHNGPRQEGFCAMQRNTRRGRRCDVYRGYLQPALSRPNLVVWSDTHVQRIVLNDGRASAVEFKRGGVVSQVAARREILLAAGALASPQLLQLSGIGSPEKLRGLGIEPLIDLPGVGRNLHTHPVIKLSFRCKLPVSLYPATRFPGKWLAGLRWLVMRDGPAASSSFDVGGFMRSRDDLDRPDLQFTLVPLALGDLYSKFDGHGFEIYVELIGCKSRGWTALRSSDPSELPRFCFQFLQDQRDIQAFVRGLHIVRKMLAQPAFSPYAGESLIPKPGEETDEEWIRRTVSISHHLAGSCRMGASNDEQAVVTPELKVRGVEGLRVIDASVMPTVTSGNTHAPVIMIAERASDLILQAQ
jgi:choline dehydrogenase